MRKRREKRTPHKIAGRKQRLSARLQRAFDVGVQTSPPLLLLERREAADNRVSGAQRSLSVAVSTRGGDRPIHERSESKKGKKKKEAAATDIDWKLLLLYHERWEGGERKDSVDACTLS